jgi:hypothetical protein
LVVATFAGWAFAVPVFSLPPFGAGSLLAPGLVSLLAGEPLTGTFVAAFAGPGFTALGGSAFLESFFGSALAGLGFAAGFPRAASALACTLAGWGRFALFFTSVFRAF